MDLKSKRCVPCEGGTPKLTGPELMPLLGQVEGWESRDERLRRTFRFADFKAAMRFIDRMAEIAEEEGHHPDFCVHYDKVDVTLWTHAAGGLTENDFILAAKIDAITPR